MTAEKLPAANDSILARPLELATRLVLRQPQTVLTVALLAAVLSLVGAFLGLHMRTSRLDLLNPQSSYNQRWLAYLREFGEEDDAVVVVEGPGEARVTQVLDDLAAALAHEPDHFDALLYRRDLDRIRAKGLHFLSADQLQQVERFLAEVAPIADGQWNRLGCWQQLRGTNQQLQQLLAVQPSPSADALALAARLGDQAGRLSTVLDNPAALAREESPLARLSAIGDRLASHHLLADEGRLGLLLLRLKRDDGSFTAGSEAIDKLREILAKLESRYDDVELGVTGLPVLENDEMRASQVDMLRASLLSLAGVAGLFIAGFGGVRYPLMTVGCLILAIAWSFGYITLAVGHLNILSVSFGVILIGLGIDFGIHYVARYLQVRYRQVESSAALRETSVSVGPGIVAGGVTTSLAFCTAGLTEFTGVAELGLIAGGGILLCIIAALLVLPACISLADRGKQQSPVPLPMGSLCAPLTRFPRLGLLLTLVVTGVLSLGITNLRIDHNLLNLQPKRLESVRLERRLLSSTDQSVWFALSMADSPAELRRLKGKFDKLPTVSRTEEVVSLLPASAVAKVEAIGRIRVRLADLPSEPPLISVADPDQLDQELAAAQTLLERLSGVSVPMPARLESVWRRLQEAREKLRSLPKPQLLARLSQGQQLLARALLAQLRQLRSMTDSRPPRAEDLPPNLAHRFIGRSGRYLIKVYARGDVWGMESLERFVQELESVDPLVTGHPVQTYYASGQMAQSYLDAAVYSLLAVAVVLMIDFRSVRQALLALSPLSLGMLQMLGLLGWLNIPLNPANMLVLPLILGIGIDDGVHVIHDYRRQSGRYRLSNSTAMAILLTSATTMVGFGSMMLARHQGLNSLGQVLTIGVFCCLGTSILFLPALLTCLTRHRPELPADEVPMGHGQRGGEGQVVPPASTTPPSHALR